MQTERVFVAALFLLSASAGSASAQCLEWSTRFAGHTGILGVQAWAEFQGALYVFGIDGQQARVFQRFDGVSFRPAGTVPNANTRDAEVYDDGTGPNLYVVGEYPGTHVQRFDGTNWTPMPGLTGPSAYATDLHVHDDGSGSQLFAAGRFTAPGANIAKWNGTAWTPLGSGLDGEATALGVYDEGSGPRLFVSGAFNSAGGVPAAGFARWDGASWSAVGAGPGGEARRMAVHDDGSGPALYVVVGNGVRRWNGSSWTTVGSGFNYPPTDLAVHDDGTGPALYATGFGTQLQCARWNGVAWSALPGPVQYASRVGSFGGALYIAGATSLVIGGMLDSAIVAWNGLEYRRPSTAAGLGHSARSLVVHDDGSGPALYAGGLFRSGGNTPLGVIGRWDGSRWSQVGGGLAQYVGSSPFVSCVGTYDDGTGPKLYAGGQLYPTPSSFEWLAAWDGTNWTGLPTTCTGTAQAMCVYDDGTGPALYVGGVLWLSSLPTNIARWNGTSWSGVGAVGNTGTSFVSSLVTFDNGSGPKLYACGRFEIAGGVTARNVASWNGTTWAPVGAGLGAAYPFECYALTVHDDGSGPALYAGGGFTSPSVGVARFDGTAWQAVGTGSGQRTRALLSYDDGTGRALYTTGSVGIEGVRRWRGGSWATVGSILGSVWFALAAFDDGSGESLYVGGTFNEVDGRRSTNIASWTAHEVALGYCFGDGTWSLCPCGNPSTPSERAGCANSFGTGGALRGDGCASLASDSLTLRGSGMTNGAALYFQGTNTTNLGAGAAFGDGLRCASGSTTRLATLANSGGASTLPDVSNPTPLSVGGGVSPAGGARTYQVWYRNAAGFCTAATFNLTNAVQVTWRP